MENTSKLMQVTVNGKVAVLGLEVGETDPPAQPTGQSRRTFKTTIRMIFCW